MKLIILRILLILILSQFTRCNNLPYEFEIWKIDYKTIQINDKNGYPIISEGYCINGNEELGRIKKFDACTKNTLGFVIILYTEDNIRRYVAIKPKTIQHHIELEADYTVYSEDQYNNLKLEGKWNKIRYNNASQQLSFRWVQSTNNENYVERNLW
jgi:hypothetical protein